MRTLIDGIADRGFGEFFVLGQGCQTVSVDKNINFFAIDYFDSVNVAAFDAIAQVVKVRRKGLVAQPALGKLQRQESDKNGNVDPAKVELGTSTLGTCALGTWLRLGCGIFFAHLDFKQDQ